jgi:hypothetical protein
MRQEATFTEDEKKLIRLVRQYYHLQEGGFFHGRFGNKEAQRRRDEIKTLRDKLGLTTKQQTSLVNRATLTNFK